MDPEVGCHGLIANRPAGSICSKYEFFLVNGCKGMDFKEIHILKLYYILTSSSTAGMDPGV